MNMTSTGRRVLAREYQPMRGAGRVAPMLRESMADLGVSAKELAMQMRSWAALDPEHRWPVDYRTIQNAMQGNACTLDTYLALAGFLGWEFAERIQTPIHGADPLTALEIEIERERAEINAREVRLQRGRAANSARRAVVSGGLRLVPEEDRAWRTSPGFGPRGMGSEGDR